MATTFPVTTYPLDSRSGFRDEYLVAVDTFDDGSMAARQLSADEYRTMDIIFEPMDLATAKTFEEYLRTNKGIEWDMTLEYGSPQTVYRGFVMGETRVDHGAGNLVIFSFTYRGKVV